MALFKSHKIKCASPGQKLCMACCHSVFRGTSEADQIFCSTKEASPGLKHTDGQWSAFCPSSPETAMFLKTVGKKTAYLETQAQAGTMLLKE